MTLTREFCELLALLGLGTFSDDPGGDLFELALPPDPDSAKAVARYGGAEAASLHGYDEPRVQVRVRGPRGDAEAAEAAAQAVYDELHGLPRRALPGGTVLLSCIGTQSGPVYLGHDEHIRHEWSVNFRCELRRVTSNRR